MLFAALVGGKGGIEGEKMGTSSTVVETSEAEGRVVKRIIGTAVARRN